ncbi:hypothetical protein Pve01_15690 [Planomonospora venezuelensis]|nr:hypothetical protein Pve01_15690 [Planomonospora venezuelensis]
MERIITIRDSGQTWRSVADALNTDRVPTAQGGVLRPGTVSHVYRTNTSGPPPRGVRRAAHDEFLRQQGVYD